MSNNLPLVSVCIPAYNHEKYVTDCLKSVIGQTYENIELIIIDDGSKDETKQKILDLMPDMEKRFVRVFFESQSNMGTCRTINKLYENTNGKYVYHIASDDMAKPDAISTLVDFLEANNEYALAVGDNEIIDGDGVRAFWDENRNNVYDVKDAKYLTFGDFLKKTNQRLDFSSEQFGTYSTLFGNNYVPNGYLVRYEILKKTGPLTPNAPLEDWWFMLQISKYAKMKYIDKVLFSYRWHGANTINNVERILSMFDKTAKYEWNLLKKLKFSGMLPDVRKTYRRECRRRFVHSFIYHRTQIDDKIVLRLFGFIHISYKK